MRYKGIGMPKAKKKSVTVIEPIVEEPAEEEDTPDPPAAPSTPPSSATIVAPQSPSKTLLLKVQRRARTMLKKTRKECHDIWQGADAMLKKATGRLYDARIKAMLRAQKRKSPPSIIKEQKQLLDAELAYARAQHQHTFAQLQASEHLLKLAEAEYAAQHAKIVRLTCQLRVARRASRYRRGWSTTRVRFRI